MSYRIVPARAVVRADVCLLKSRLSYSLLALACAWPLSAMAQSSTRDPVDLDRMQIHAHRGAATEGTDSYTADVARSSTKLQLSLRETPQSVVVVTRQQIVDRNLQSLQDVTDTVAGFNSPTWDTERTYINARGFEVDYYRIDGIPTDYSGDVQQNMAIYDRVEIIRGANGLTSGAGSPAASIDLVRKHADSDVFTGRVDLSAGRWDRYRGTVDLQSPLNTAGNVRGRVVTSYEDKQSFRDYYSKQSSLFYGIVDADFSDATSGYIGVNKQRNDGRGTTWGGVPAYFSDGSRTDFARSDSFTPRWARGVADTTNAFAGLTHRFDNGAQLHVEYSHQRFEADWKSVLFGYLDYPDRDTGLGLASNFGGRYPTLSAQNSLDAYATVPLMLWGREHGWWPAPPG
ncbi:TonB-dependent receptor plug domain-containing protein [Xanthomonas hortorum pv. pelargonii]|nr:TonB-dependent receptor plug domain-containing protein [Xanthomonas hortorum pv. pelargonii]